RNIARISERHDAVARLVAADRLRARLREALDGVRDVERLAARAAAGRANPREMGALRDSLLRLPAVVAVADEIGGTRLTDPLADLAADLAASLTDRPPITLADGDVIRAGADAEIDELRHLRDHGKQALAAIQQRE